MANKNYRRGYVKELEACRELEKMGFMPFRSAGSHGVFDVIGLGPKDNIALQIKRVKKPCNSLRSFSKDIEQIMQANVSPNTEKALWVWIDRKGWEKIVVGKGEK